MSDCKEHGDEWMDLVSMSPDGSGCDEICWLCYALNQLNEAGRSVLDAHIRQAKEQAWDLGCHDALVSEGYAVVAHATVSHTNPYRSQP